MRIGLHVALAALLEDKNLIMGEYMTGEHLGSPLHFPHLELVLLFDIFINFISVGGRPGCLPNLMPLPPTHPLIP